MKELFFSEVFRRPRAFPHYTSVRKPVIQPGERQTDVDLIILENGRPERAVAIECKKAKVIKYADGSEKVNKLHEIEKGILQANHLQSKGFYKSFLMVIIVTDGREFKGLNTMFRYGTSDQVKPFILCRNMPSYILTLA